MDRNWSRFSASVTIGSPRPRAVAAPEVSLMTKHRLSWVMALTVSWASARLLVEVAAGAEPGVPSYRYDDRVPRSTVLDRKATPEEVEAHAESVRDLAADLGLGRVRLRGDGTVVVRSPEPGYRAVMRLAAAASEIVGSYVHVITDDVAGAVDTRDL